MPIPKMVVTAALMAVQVAIGMTRKTFGPRLDSLKTTTAEYGTPIPRFWGKRKFEVPLIWAEDLREEKKTGKGKGGKSVEYKYFGTFGVLICDHLIEAVTRIWMDDKLVYDVTRAGPISLASLLSRLNAPVKIGKRNMRVYLGIEDQMPDPRMEAWCEDRYGADSCPAYRGSAYIVFEELLLEKFGNRIPNITVEAVSAKADAYPYELRDTASGAGRFVFGGNWMAYADGYGSVEWWDVPSRTRLGSSPDSTASGSSSRPGMASDGALYYVGWDAVGIQAWWYLYRTHPLEAPIAMEIVDNRGSLSFSGVTRVIEGEPVQVLSSYTSRPGYISGTVHIPDAQNARDFSVGPNGQAWGLFQPLGASDSFTVKQLGGGFAAFTFTASVSRTGPTFATLAWVGDHWFVYMDGWFYIIDGDGTQRAAGAMADVPDYLPQNGVSTVWVDFKEYSMETGALLRSVNKSDWRIGADGSRAYDSLNHAIWSRETGTGTIVIRYLDRVASNGVSLKTVVDDVSEWCGLTGQDTLALTQTVQGYSVTQGTGKDMLGPLLDMHDVDARPHDFTVQFVNRGGAPSGSLLTRDFVRDGDSARYTVTIQQDSDLPKEISAKFADVDRDQQINTAIAQRPLDATDSKRTEEIDLSTLADTADGAQRKLERFFRRIWNSRERIKLSLTAQHLALEPGDVTTPSLDGLARNARLDKLTIRGSVLDCEFVRDETSFAALSNSTGAPIEGSDPDVIAIPAATKGFVLDIPLVDDADADIKPLLYIAAGSYAGTWPGALAYEDDELIASIESDTKATWGYARSKLKAANPNLWDRGNTLDVTVLGTLVSSTEAAIDADPRINLCAVGADGRWEILNFATATLTGTSGAGNLYTLSGLKRGRRGTEGNIEGHAAGDSFVMLNMAHIVERGSDDIGDTLSFKVQTVGRDPDTTTAIEMTFSGATLKPYAPARVKWSTDGTDMFGEIVRRTRVGGSWNGGSTIPLAENSEAYEVEIYRLGVLKRTISVSGNTFTYAAADIAADGNTVGTVPSVNVYQLSDAVGRGFALAA